MYTYEAESIFFRAHILQGERVVYMFSRNMWVGPYGELRLNLLDWLIAKVETSLTDLKAK